MQVRGYDLKVELVPYQRGFYVRIYDGRTGKTLSNCEPCVDNVDPYDRQEMKMYAGRCLRNVKRSLNII